MLNHTLKTSRILILRRWIPKPISSCKYSTGKTETTDEMAPIKFSTSPAARRTVRFLVKRPTVDMPWYQPYSVVVSVAVFLIYFCILREENDIDLEFDKTLYQRIHGLEKEQLLQCYKYNKENGLSVADIEKRLKEIEEEEAKKAEDAKAAEEANTAEVVL